ncbi:unnamed protein product [Triticum turgidum subsp. durum]|uniref:Adaptor protein ClpS core domain-containing protein n=1 Tax=Triticum turgidum subsp. durum TaxID=4567 RepID=A0A9R1R0T2_TRITD|nr:unnamed protein product [Triticum turgidum subsp. durum]
MLPGCSPAGLPSALYRPLHEPLPQQPRCGRKCMFFLQTNDATPIVITAAAPGKGGGVLDRPAEKVSPGRQFEFDKKKSRKMSPPFRVVLHNDNENRREYVVQVLMKVIPGMTVDNAVNIMQEAHVNGMAVVIVCSQPEAEEHCTALRGNGLRSSIEPASGGC